MTATHALSGHDVKSGPSLGSASLFIPAGMTDFRRAYLDCKEGLGQRVHLVIELAVWKLPTFFEKQFESGR